MRDAFLAERRRFLATLRDLGPEVPTLCGDWTAADLAAHVAGGDMGAGVPVFIGRSLVARGALSGAWRARARSFEDRSRARLKRRGFEWATSRLARTPPALLHRGRVAAVSLFEVWVHHEDLRRANGRGPDPARDHPELRACLDFLDRFLRAPLSEVTVVVIPALGPFHSLGTGPHRMELRGSVGEAVLWLAGRQSVADVAVEGDQTELSRLVARLAI